jgi:glucose-1-phosphate adenylyltransferase
MGIYLFKTKVLVDLLKADLDDFGSDVIPSAIQSHHVYGYQFDGYWEDIGTMRSFYEANLALAQPSPSFSFHDPIRPIYTHMRFLPGSRIYDVRLDRVLLADGCIVEGAEIRSSIIGLRSMVGDDVVIEDSVIMGADYYETPDRTSPPGSPPMGIGHGPWIERTIVDKNARIGDDVRITPDGKAPDFDGPNFYLRDGIVIIPKNGVVPNGTVI